MQWYGVKGVHASEAMKVMNAEGGGDRVIVGVKREVCREVRVESVALVGKVVAGGRAVEAFPRGVDVAEVLRSSSLSVRLTGMFAACSRVLAC